MNPRCKPGDLCLILKGEQAGQTLTVIREAAPEEIRQTISQKLDRPALLADKNDFFWLVDRNCNWAATLPKQVLSIPYEIDSFLLPIQPPADMTDDGMEAEKIIFHAIGNSK